MVLLLLDFLVSRVIWFLKRFSWLMVNSVVLFVISFKLVREKRGVVFLVGK